MSNTTTTAYQFDCNGYFIGETMVMSDPLAGGWLVPADCTLTKPTAKKGYWNVFNKDTKEWGYELIPTTAAELENLTVLHEDQSKHKYELKNLVDTLVTDNSGYETKRDDDNNITVVKKAPVPEPTLDELKDKKLDELTAAGHQFDDRLVNEDMIINSSLGFKANADLRSQNNINGLLAAGQEPVAYVDSQNAVHSLTLAQLNTLLAECIENGQYLYQQKWAYRAKINACTTKEELEAIIFDFKMKDFNEQILSQCVSIS